MFLPLQIRLECTSWETLHETLASSTKLPMQLASTMALDELHCIKSWYRLVLRGETLGRGSLLALLLYLSSEELNYNGGSLQGSGGPYERVHLK